MLFVLDLLKIIFLGENVFNLTFVVWYLRSLDSFQIETIRFLLRDYIESVIYNLTHVLFVTCPQMRAMPFTIRKIEMSAVR